MSVGPLPGFWQFPVDLAERVKVLFLNFETWRCFGAVMKSVSRLLYFFYSCVMVDTYCISIYLTTG